MGKIFVNLVRKTLPKLSMDSKKNIEAIKNMPEVRLATMMQSGGNDIVHVGMNQCGAALIKENGVNIIFTDGLAGCNSVGLVAKTLEGKPFAVLSHYVPSAMDRQVKNIGQQLETYSYYLDKKYKPKLFFNILAVEINGQLTLGQNPIIEKAKALLAKYFPQGFETSVTPYPSNGSRPAFYSSANIFQFSPQDLNKLEIINVGENVKNIDLKM